MLDEKGVFKDYTTDKFDKVAEGLVDLIRQACEVQKKIESLLGRPLTGYECLHGINI